MWPASPSGHSRRSTLGVAASPTSSTCSSPCASRPPPLSLLICCLGRVAHLVCCAITYACAGKARSDLRSHLCRRGQANWSTRSAHDGYSRERYMPTTPLGQLEADTVDLTPGQQTKPTRAEMAARTGLLIPTAIRCPRGRPLPVTRRSTRHSLPWRPRKWRRVRPAPSQARNRS